MGPLELSDTIDLLFVLYRPKICRPCQAGSCFLVSGFIGLSFWKTFSLLFSTQTQRHTLKHTHASGSVFSSLKKWPKHQLHQQPHFYDHTTPYFNFDYIHVFSPLNPEVLRGRHYVSGITIVPVPTIVHDTIFLLIPS